MSSLLQDENLPRNEVKNPFKHLKNPTMSYSGLFLSLFSVLSAAQLLNLLISVLITYNLTLPTTTCHHLLISSTHTPYYSLYNIHL